jgi:hypothetical protein
MNNSLNKKVIVNWEKIYRNIKFFGKNLYSPLIVYCSFLLATEQHLNTHELALT